MVNFQTSRRVALYRKLAASQIKDDKKISLSTLLANGKVLQQGEKLQMKNVVAETIAATAIANSNTKGHSTLHTHSRIHCELRHSTVWTAECGKLISYTL